jgi:hypothetical protein
MPRMIGKYKFYTKAELAKKLGYKELNLGKYGIFVKGKMKKR